MKNCGEKWSLFWWNHTTPIYCIYKIPDRFFCMKVFWVARHSREKPLPFMLHFLDGDSALYFFFISVDSLYNVGQEMYFCALRFLRAFQIVFFTFECVIIIKGNCFFYKHFLNNIAIRTLCRVVRLEDWVYWCCM